MNIKDLISVLEITDIINEQDLIIENLAYHSKKVSKNDLFVCVKGYQVDGHKYLKNAFENGCIAAVVEDFIPEIKIMQIKVKDSRLALALLADKYYNHPSRKMNIIGITATNGKTTTSFLLNEILETNKLKTGLMGTVIIKVNDKKIPSDLTTPESLDIQKYFNDMQNVGVSNVTMEVSSSALELNRTAQVDFDITALNNISREHLDSHGSFENYYNFKAGLIRNLKPEGFAVLNLDDDYSKKLINETKATTFTYGVENKNGHISISNLNISTGRAKFTVNILKQLPIKHNYLETSFDIELSIPGYHCVYNSLVAISIALILGIPISDIQEGIKKFKGIERRFEYIFEEDFKIIDDHFANTGNINVTLETLNFMDYNKLNLLYAIRGSRGFDVNKENAETIVKWLKKLDLKEITATSSKSHVTWKDVVTKEELNIFFKVMKEANIKVNYFEELPEAIAFSLENIKKDDVLLLAGCQGMDYGCNIVLNQIEKLRPELDRDKLRSPLKFRVAGLLEGDSNE